MIPVIAANRMEFLRQGRIDLIIATMGDTPERRKVVGMVEPNYYAGATNVLAPKSANLKTWQDLKGRKTLTASIFRFFTTASISSASCKACEPRSGSRRSAWR